MTIATVCDLCSDHTSMTDRAQGDRDRATVGDAVQDDRARGGMHVRGNVVVVHW